MTQLPLLPYQLSRYPDEILGSWLARIALHNGPGAWVALLESIGYGRGIITLTMFDMVNYDDRIETLLKLLGTTYERAIMEATTYPYWRAFDAADVSLGVLPGTKNMPRLASKTKGVVASLAAVNKTSSAAETRRIRYCPQCIDQDHSTWGEPYWHRVHQLPSVFFCPEHDCALSTSCPECDRPLVLVGWTLVEPPPLQCRCGYDLRKANKIAEAPPVYRELARLSASALNHQETQWDQALVRNYLRAELASSGALGGPTYTRTISQAFCVESATDQTLYVRVPGQSPGERPWRLRNRICSGSAPESCALMTALGIEFSSAAQGFIALKGVPHNDLKQRAVPLETMTIESARREIEERMIRHPDWNPSNHMGPYWFLRINDDEWLRQRFPNSKQSSMPSVLDDRREILRLRTDTSLRPNQRDGRMTSLSLRARIRDLDWYREQDGRSLRPRRSGGALISADILHTRTVRVHKALQDLLAEEKRPHRIGRNELATMSGLSCSQVASVVLSSSDLGRAIAEVNEDKNRRLLRWAILQLLEEGKTITSKTICRRAGLPTFRGVNAIISDIRKELAVTAPSTKLPIDAGLKLE